jgi:hypothetical protein
MDITRLASLLTMDVDLVANWPKLIYLPRFQDNYGTVTGTVTEQELLRDAFPDRASIAWDIDQCGRIVLLIRISTNKYRHCNVSVDPMDAPHHGWLRNSLYNPEETLITVYERYNHTPPPVVTYWRMHIGSAYYCPEISGSKYPHVISKPGNRFLTTLLTGGVVNINRIHIKNDDRYMASDNFNLVYFKRGESTKFIQVNTEECSQADAYFVTIKDK